MQYGYLILHMSSHAFRQTPVEVIQPAVRRRRSDCHATFTDGLVIVRIVAGRELGASNPSTDPLAMTTGIQMPTITVMCIVHIVLSGETSFLSSFLCYSHWNVFHDVTDD